MFTTLDAFWTYVIYIGRGRRTLLHNSDLGCHVIAQVDDFSQHRVNQI